MCVLQLHYLMHGNGFQTWEYSPAYGIRSYSYIILHSIPLLPFKTLDKVCVWCMCGCSPLVCVALYLPRVLHTCVSSFKLIWSNLQVIQFYILRVFLVVVCATCEWYFIRCVCVCVCVRVRVCVCVCVL